MKDCIYSSAGDLAKCKITDAKLHVPIVILSTKDNVNLTEQLLNGFKRSAFLNNYQIIPAKVINQGTNIYESSSASCKVLKDYLFLLMSLLQMLQIMKQV